MNKSNVFIIKVIIIIITNVFLCHYIGSMYLNRFNQFVKENNSIFIKKEINNIIKDNFIEIRNNLYSIVYNDKNEIININLNVNDVNVYLSDYIKVLNKSLNNVNYNYLDNYYSVFKTCNNKYFILPLGVISDNPFVFNLGPRVLLNYDLLNVPTIKIKVQVKNYGLNNALIETYLIVNIDQSILKPVLENSSSYNYSFLISSKIINGRVSNYLGTNFNVESGTISS